MSERTTGVCRHQTGPCVYCEKGNTRRVVVHEGRRRKNGAVSRFPCYRDTDVAALERQNANLLTAVEYALAMFARTPAPSPLASADWALAVRRLRQAIDAARTEAPPK